MNIRLKKLFPEFTEGIEILAEKLGFTLSNEGEGIELEAVQKEKGLSVSLKSGKAVIGYEKPCHFFRGLGILVQKLGQGVSEFAMEEIPKFENMGAMFDTSRHAALNIKTIKDYLTYMALMGYNELFLYMEDTYEVEGYPYIGYMRGRYNYEELKSCDDYAAKLGIEIVPCIQTLGHLLQVFKKGVNKDIIESEDLIRVGEEKSYVFLEKLIETASRPFRSRRIHLGMDEAFALGQKREGVKTGEDRMKILLSHIKSVCEITKKHGLTPMIFSDMLFRLSSKTFAYYDLEARLSEKFMAELPEELGIMYEDSKSEEEAEFSEFISRHQVIKRPLTLAPAVSTGDEFCFSYDHLLSSASSAVKAGMKAGINELVAISWGDGGAALSNVFSMFGLFYYAELTYKNEDAVNAAEEYFAFCTGCNADIFKEIARLDYPAEKCAEDNLCNATKFILRQDIMLGMYDYDIMHVDWEKHYQGIKERLTELLCESGNYRELTEFYIMLCDALTFKATVGIRIKALYDAQDKQRLAEILVGEATKAEKLFIDLGLKFSKLWRIYNRPFASELMDMRFGSIVARIRTMKMRISAYLNDEINKIDELEEKRLPFNRIDKAITCRNDITYGTSKSKVVSACSVGRY